MRSVCYYVVLVFFYCWLCHYYWPGRCSQWVYFGCFTHLRISLFVRVHVRIVRTHSALLFAVRINKSNNKMKWINFHEFTSCKGNMKKNTHRGKHKKQNNRAAVQDCSDGEIYAVLYCIWKLLHETFPFFIWTTHDTHKYKTIAGIRTLSFRNRHNFFSVEVNAIVVCGLFTVAESIVSLF